MQQQPIKVSGIPHADVFTPTELAKYLGVSRKTVVRRLEEGQLPGRKIGIKWRTTKTAVDNFLSGK